MKKTEGKNPETANSVTIEGLAYSCEIRDTAPGRVLAFMEISTAAQDVRQDGTIEYSNWLRHRVAVAAGGAKAEKLRDIALKCRANKESYGSKDFVPSKIPVAVRGEFAVNDSGQQLVTVKEDALEFPEKLRMRNSITFAGTLVETTHNDLYATAVLRSRTSDGRDVFLPMIIYNNDNPKAWADLAGGKVKKGDTVSTTGPLISKRYNGTGGKEIFRCSVNADRYAVTRKLTARKTQSAQSI